MMVSRSALSIVFFFLLASSLNEAEANASRRRTRGTRPERITRNLGIGFRRNASSTKSKGGGKSKEGSKSKGYTSSPTESTITGRVPVTDDRTTTPPPTSFWFPDSNGPAGGSTEGRIDGGDSQTVIDVNPGGSNTFDNIPATDNEDDLSGTFDNLFDGGNGDANGDANASIEVENGNEGGNEPGGKKPPKGLGEGPSIETGLTIGGSDSDENSDNGDSNNVDAEGTSSNGAGDSSENGDSSSGVDGSVGDGAGTPEQSGGSSIEAGDSDKSGGQSDTDFVNGSGENGESSNTEGNSGGDVTAGSVNQGVEGESSEENGSNDENNNENDNENNNDSNQSAGDGTDSTGTDTNDANDGGFDPTVGNSTVGEWGVVPTDDYVPDESTAVFCPEVSSDKEVLVNWIYAVEFQPNMTNEEKLQTVTIMELKLVSEILQCNSQVALPGKRFVRHRHLSEDGVAGLNYLPLDARNDNVVCFFSNTNNTDGGVCETYFGRMEMYLEEDADENIAITNMLYKIRDTMQRNDFPAVDGIARVWYLDPTLGEVDGIAEDGIIVNDSPPGDSDSYSTGTMIAFAALGIFVFAAIFLGAFRMRRRENEDVVTYYEHSTVTGPATTPNDSYGAKQAGTFVLPSSYQLDAVPEDDDESRYNCSVIISDGGFTSDGESREGDPAFATQLDNVLASETEEEDDMNNDMLFQNDTDFSEHRKNNLVSGSEVGLGVKHSSVDVHQCTSARCTICNYKPKDVEFIHKSPTTPAVSTGNFFPEDDDDAIDEDLLSVDSI